MRYYALVDKQAIEIEDLLEWARVTEQRWDMIHDHRVDPWSVARDEVGHYVVSTVFLGIDYNWSGNGRPLVFETAVMADDGVTIEGRYSTWDEAADGHARYCAVYQTLNDVETTR